MARVGQLVVRRVNHAREFAPRRLVATLDLIEVVVDIVRALLRRLALLKHFLAHGPVGGPNDARLFEC